MVIPPRAVARSQPVYACQQGGHVTSVCSPAAAARQGFSPSALWPLCCGTTCPSSAPLAALEGAVERRGDMDEERLRPQRLRLLAEPRDGATYVTVLGPGGRRIPTGILTRAEDVAAFNALPPAPGEMPAEDHALYLALVQEAQSEHWQGSAADRAWL